MERVGWRPMFSVVIDNLIDIHRRNIAHRCHEIIDVEYRIVPPEELKEQETLPEATSTDGESNANN